MSEEKGKVVVESRIEKRGWDVDDDYLVVPGFQVHESDGFREGQRVRVTVEVIE